MDGFCRSVHHVQTGDAPQNVSAMLAGVLADSTNLGPNAWQEPRKASAPIRSAGCGVSMPGPKPTERRRQALPTRIHAIRIPQLWGDGPTASSDGQFFRASDRAAKRSDINLHYGSEPGPSFKAPFRINTATSAFCRSARPRAKPSMFSTACLITTRSWRSRSCLPIPVALAIMSSP